MSVEQLNAGRPSSSTVHAPHAPSPQPYFVPVTFRSSRSTSRSDRSPGVFTSVDRPFTVSVIAESSEAMGSASVETETMLTAPAHAVNAASRVRRDGDGGDQHADRVGHGQRSW